MRWAAWLLLCSLAWNWPLAGMAQRADAPTAQAEKDEQARRVFRIGQAAFEAGRYEEALDYFRQAHALSPRPQLLYNIGQSADRLRRDEEALTALEGYLAALPGAANRMEVENRVAALKRVVEGEKRRRAVAATLAGADVRLEAPSQRAAAGAAVEPARGPGAQGDDHGAARKPWFKHWWVWTAVGVVAAGAVTTVLLVGGEQQQSAPTPGTTGIVTYALEKR